MPSNCTKILLTLTRYTMVAILAFWLGQKPVNFAKESKILADDSINQIDFKIEIASLKRDLEHANKLNRKLMARLESATAVSQPMVVTETENDRRCGLLSEKLDSSLYQEAYKGIYSTDFASRERSLKALATLGTPEAKSTLIKVVMNEREDADLRLGLIRAVDWHDAIEQATNLLSSKDESVKAAVILAAQDSQLNEMEQEDFEKGLMTVFNEKNGDFIQIAAIDYLANKNPAKVSEITVLSNDPDISARVNQHIDELISNF